YGDRKGTTASFHPIGANPSTTVVPTWIATKTIATSVTVRWTPATAKRGILFVRQRIVVAMPRQIDAVSSRSAKTPEPRVRYQNALGDVFAARRLTPAPVRAASR